MTEVVTLRDIEEARAIVERSTVLTPMLESRWLSGVTGHDVWLKCENLQRTGSFKIRGASVRLAHLGEQERASGVVAASAGNHAQGVALAAQQLGITATVFMPEGAPIPKERATRGYGADVAFVPGTLEDALHRAQQEAAETGKVFIHPFDHPHIVAGQGTLGLEVIEQCPEAGTVLIPAGGGGLITGAAVAIKSLRPDVRVIGVQAAGAAAFPASLAAGHPIRLAEMNTMADGIAVGQPGELTFALWQEYVDDVLTVTEEELSRALLTLVEREKLVVEPAGAVAAAAVAEHPDMFRGPVTVVLSGGNIDPLLLGKVIQHGMAAERRYLSLEIKIADVPGGLARLLTEVGAAGANVLEVEHQRVSPALHLHEVDVLLQLETRGVPHAESVLARLREHGYVVRERG